MMLAESIPGESAMKARKDLRRDMVNRLTEGSREFLEALSEVDLVRSLFLSPQVDYILVITITTISSIRNSLNSRLMLLL